MANTILTIRLPVSLRAKLRRQAKALGKTESEFVRDLMTNGLDKQSRAEKLAKLAGSLSFDGVKLDPFQQHIKDMNWRS
jgi:predicted DNA-binding protein